MHIVADIGGTNTRIGFVRSGTLDQNSIKRFKNKDFETFYDLLSGVADGAEIESVCIAVAGPVLGHEGRLTNWGWTFETDALAKSANAPKAFLLNDLQAQGYALAHLPKEASSVIQNGAGEKQSQTRLVIGVGTGCNAAPIYEMESGSFVPPSEAGHTRLPIIGPKTAELAEFLNRQTGFSDVEDVLSGRGLQAVYAHVLGPNSHTEAPKSELIIQLADEGNDKALEAVHLSVHVLAEFSSSLALVHLPFGGIFLVGGMARALSRFADAANFLGTFTAKGRFSDLMETFPISVVEDDNAALLGCMQYITQQMRVAS